MNIQHPDIVIRHLKTKKKLRKIVAYRSDDCELRVRHQKIASFLEDNFIPSIFAKGYIKKRSIFHNSIAHLSNNYFVMLDIKDFFPRICHKQLIDKIYHEINLHTPGQISKKECIEIVDSCSINSRGLPLGFVTSPILSNIYLKEFDNIFYGTIRKMRLDNIMYTRYADDITVSFRDIPGDAFSAIQHDIIVTAAKLLKRYGLQLNESKVRSCDLFTSNHVKITGICIVRDDTGKHHLSVGRSMKNAIFWDALNAYESKNENEIARIKGLQSFILSIEKSGYERGYSLSMKQIVQERGYSSLKELIDDM